MCQERRNIDKGEPEGPKKGLFSLPYTCPSCFPNVVEIHSQNLTARLYKKKKFLSEVLTGASTGLKRAGWTFQNQPWSLLTKALGSTVCILALSGTIFLFIFRDFLKAGDKENIFNADHFPLWYRRAAEQLPGSFVYSIPFSTGGAGLSVSLCWPGHFGGFA